MKNVKPTIAPTLRIYIIHINKRSYVYNLLSTTLLCDILASTLHTYICMYVCVLFTFIVITAVCRQQEL